MTIKLFSEHCDVSRETLARLSVYADLLERWQPKINLISSTSLPDLWRRHILDSAQLVDHIPPKTKIISDLGSGAGFPGLVIAIITGIETHLVESDSRKCAFLREVIRQTEATAIIHNGRAEIITPWFTDIVTARALAPLPKLLAYTYPFLNKSTDTDAPGCLFLKGGNWREELTEAEKSWHIECQNVMSITDPTGRLLIIRNPTPKLSGE